MAGLFDFSEERAVAARLVVQLEKQLPAKLLDEEGMAKLSVNKITRMLERVYQEVPKQLGGRKLGLLRRSILANAFKWNLTEKGYPPKFVSVATEGLIMEIAKGRK